MIFKYFITMNFSWSILIIVITVRMHLCMDTVVEIDMNIMELIPYKGYPVEEHTVITEDDYILTMYRIPHGRWSNSTNKNPILLVHGMTGCSENFITMGKDDAIAYNLADAGYDVWLINSRGNFHSRKHIRLDPNNDREYWLFTFHEVGVYDMPASIDYILDNTNETNLVLLGHSQGGTAFFIMLSERPEYTDKIKLSIQFAPSVLFGFITSPMAKIFGSIVDLQEKFYEMLNIYEIYPNNELLMESIKELCSTANWLRRICTYVIYFIGGSDTQSLNETITQYIVSNSPAGTSVKTSMHYLQGMYYGCLRKYDYGYKKNLKLYKRSPPPLYNLINAVPTAILYGDGDWFVPAHGVKALLKLIPYVVYSSELHNFNHVDFIFSKDVKEKVNIPLIKFMNHYLNVSHNDSEIE